MRTFEGQKRQTRTYEDNSRTDLEQAKDKKGLAEGSHRGIVQF